MIWFTSDTHYGHKNICRGVSDWNNLEGTRDFQTISEMNDKIVENINSVVERDDILYHLGDWSFGGPINICKFRERINCENLYIVPGNHDHHIINNTNLQYKWIREFNGPLDQWLEWDDDFATKEECLKACDSYYIPYRLKYSNAQDFFTEVLPPIFNLKYNKKLIVLSHYPIESWECKSQNSIHLHGHCHHALDSSIENTFGRRMDIGIDWEEFRPYSIDEILIIMQKRNEQNKQGYTIKSYE